MNRTTRRVRAGLATVLVAAVGTLGVPAADAAGACPTVTVDGTLDRAAAPYLDWSGCDLTGANLAGASLRFGNLTGANLTGANLAGTDLYMTTFTGATLTGADLSRAQFQYTNLSQVNAANTTFTDAVGAAKLYQAHLEGATFTRSFMAGSDMRDTSMDGAMFTDADMRATMLSYAGLRGAHIRTSNFASSNAPDLGLYDAIVDRSNFSGSALNRIKINGATLTNNNFDRTTIWGSMFASWTVTSSGNTWAGATCSDNKPSGAHLHGDCLQDPDLSAPFARPSVVGPGTGVGHWYTGPVTINWNWYDEGVLSDTSCPRSTVGVSLAGTVTATCTDVAGYTGTGNYDVRFDQVPPSLSATVSHAPNGLNGWWRTAPTVNYTCSDTGSGIARCPGPVTAGQGVRTLTVTAADVAGNTTNNYTPVKVDTVKPAVAVNLATLNSFGAHVPRCVATDATSGVATCRVTTAASANPNYRYATSTATDKAGNTAVSARVTYRATTVAAITSAPSSVSRGRTLSIVVTSKNAKGALINLTGVRALLPVKTTSTGAGAANTTLSTYATRIATGTYRVALTAPRTTGYYRYAVRVGTATVTKVIRVT